MKKIGPELNENLPSKGKASDGSDIELMMKAQ